uniref:Tetratricopeptide repeat protein 29 n=1 Tax=Albugo laibachii Nc14 TaxID=890382 RepID=F0W2L7_9STRA|nr:conserved hypothetical protein [Albugo laibachii Nc14]|eukprot:CCA15303.1 conserved hypothetical protein [Albugo laibachii Nc14]
MPKSPRLSLQRGKLARHSGCITLAPETNNKIYLSEAFPQIDLPQRIKPPENFKSPSRIAVASRDDRVRQTYFSPQAIAMKKLKKNLRAKFDNIIGLDENLTCFAYPNRRLQDEAVSAKLLKEFTILVESSKRSGRHDTEFAAYICLGIIHDNAQHYAKAIDCYMGAYLLSEKMDNTMLQALSCNYIGVDYQMLSSINIAYMYTGHFLDAGNVSLEKALFFHQKHLELSNDAGKFVAHLNLGLTSASLNLPSEATWHYQEGVRLAISNDNTQWQSLAVGNLGLLAYRHNDTETSLACIERHLQHLELLHDRSGEAYAWFLLGQIALRVGEHDKAVRSLDHAYRMSQEIGELSVTKQYSCYLGVARARMQMKDYIAEVSSSAGHNTEYD